MKIGLKHTYYLSVLVLSILVPSLHADIYDLVDLKTARNYPDEVKKQLAEEILKKNPDYFFPLILEYGDKKWRGGHYTKEGLKNNRVMIKLWGPLPKGARWSTGKLVLILRGEQETIETQWIEDTIEGKGFSLPQALFLQFLYTEKQKAPKNPMSFELMEVANDQVDSDELWEIFETFSPQVQDSLKSKYYLL